MSATASALSGGSTAHSELANEPEGPSNESLGIALFIVSEAVMFGGSNLLARSPDERRKLRGGKMSMIFQEPMTSLNPVHTVGQQIVEAIIAHSPMSPRAAWISRA